jgi:hypothetical protein
VPVAAGASAANSEAEVSQARSQVVLVDVSSELSHQAGRCRCMTLTDKEDKAHDKRTEQIGIKGTITLPRDAAASKPDQK